jgi:hypothetical protein
MTYQSSDYLKNNLGASYNANDYLSLINTPNFAHLITQDLQPIQTWQDADVFFQEHTVFIHPFAFTGQSIAGIELWLNLLERIKLIDSTNYDRIHKGTPYYHAGIYCLFATKYTEAFEWFGYAFDQCIGTGRIPDPGTPSQWMLTFDTSVHIINGERRIAADYGTTQKLLNKIQTFLGNIHIYDSRFAVTSDVLRGIIKSKIITVGTTRPLRSAWGDFLSILMAHEYTKKIIRISPNQEEAQLSAHNTLSRLTLILETFIKQIPNFSSYSNVNPHSQLGDLLQHIISTTYGFTYNPATKSIITSAIRKDYSLILGDINAAESSSEDKLAISFTVAQRIRNNAHHMFNEEYITEETFENLYLRIVYCILSVIVKYYV